MNTRTKLIPTLSLCVVTAGTLAGIFIISTTRATRADEGEDRSRRQVDVTAPVSIAEGQTLRVNFLNQGRNPFEIIPRIFDADGSHLKTGDAITLAPGQTRSFEIGRAEAGRRTEPSVVVHAAVLCDGSVRKHLVVVGEVVEDATGRTSILVPGLHVGFDPQPDPPAGP